MEVKEIQLNDINVSEFNTRKDLEVGTEDTSLDDLANSIKEKGLLNPIMVMKRPDGKYDLIAGQRRFLACRKLGLTTISAIIRDKLDDTDATIISLIENVHRADMNPIDKARAYKKIYEKYQDYEKVAKETGVSISTTRKYLTLLNLAPSIQQKLTTAEGPAGIGALSKLAETFSSEEQEEALEEIGGFKQTIQLELIKRSGGDLDKLSELKEQALEGVFDTKLLTNEDLLEATEEFLAQIKKVAGNISIDEVLLFIKTNREAALELIAGELKEKELRDTLKADKSNLKETVKRIKAVK